MFELPPEIPHIFIVHLPRDALLDQRTHPGDSHVLKWGQIVLWGPELHSGRTVDRADVFLGQIRVPQRHVEDDNDSCERKDRTKSELETSELRDYDSPFCK
jgi:hypothetical protein